MYFLSLEPPSFIFLKIFYVSDFLSIYWMCYNIISIFVNLLFFSGHEAYGSLAPQPRVEPTPSALEDKVLTIRLPRKSPGMKF